ncbi:hypothetical protein N7539_001015 [Penicillium diatomitis]|uniref:Uncharacterized protein n=1 Tax=Penicillium diatomitis TaxID=2819901 RepID=A0A9W9XMV7_9EURO|nr:uncharacterized protein N7539_001015 [Penicillium diatomitis]KAJ5495899.1 hypothetical protein N7539_001015 [Penicillium diatomitis]
MESKRSEDHLAGRRAREVYRYFRPEQTDPSQENSSPRSTSNSPPRIPPAKERSSVELAPSLGQSPLKSSATWEPLQPMPESLILGDDNETLNSFAHLAALRLNVEQVYISVSDRDSQFIIAQSAQTKQSDNRYDMIGENSHTGHVFGSIEHASYQIPLAWRLDTIALRPSNRERGEYHFVVSNDMSEDERYRELSFVAGEPGYRFYAGTPLTTESNVNIGCFFVLDTSVRLDFNHTEKETMGRMGMLIMDFLKVSRQASDGRHAARLSQGMNLFVEGHSSFEKNSSGPVSRSFDGSDNSQGKSSTSPSAGTPFSREGASRSRSRSSGAQSLSTAADSVDDRAIPSSLDSHIANVRSASQSGGSRQLPAKLWTIRRAANLIRESLEIYNNSGVIFVETSANFALDISPESDSSQSSSTEPAKPAPVLALSTPEVAFGPGVDSQNSIPAMNLDEEFLGGLLKRHKRGHIWNFHRDGQLSGSDSEDSTQGSDRRGRVGSHPSQSSRRKSNKERENTCLNRYFPGATQVIFVPLWNAGNSQWFGGFFCWTNVEHKVFSASIELSALRSFGSSIMAEWSRIESVLSDEQKDDFLGSISHELRSPLHGVLAATEMLKETKLDQYQTSLIETVEACGRTLLDTMNQVLDFSKLMALERKSRRRRRRKAVSQDFEGSHLSAARLDLCTPTDLSIVAEEVVEGVFLGHVYNQKSATSLDLLGTSLVAPEFPPDFHTFRSDVKVIVDIAPENNALKYTSSGHVRLLLESEERAETSSRMFTRRDGNKQRNVVITVSDTGKGISEDFLRNRLYTPFAQEDNLAVGSGLGLSIVRSLIQSLGGSIDIKSRVGEGTVVRAALPLAPIEPDLPQSHQNEIRLSARQDQRMRGINARESFFRGYEGRTVAILGVDPSNAASDPDWADLARYFTDWYGLSLVSASASPSASIDLLLADQLPSESAIRETSASRHTALLIVTDQHMDLDPTNGQQVGEIRSINVINRPCGPHKLWRHVSKCLEELLTVSSCTDAPVPTRNHDTFSVKSLVASLNLPEQHSKDKKSRVKQTHSFPIPSEPPSKGTAGTDPESRDARILVVEDNKVNLNLMMAYLKKRRFGNLDSAENGSKAVEAVRKQDDDNYDIIFMDISMPEMDGFEAAREIRALEKQRGPDAKPAVIIALTGLSSSEDETKALEAGMDMFLTKPISFKDVGKLLQEWKEQRLHPDTDSSERDL